MNIFRYLYYKVNNWYLLYLIDDIGLIVDCYLIYYEYVFNLKENILIWFVYVFFKIWFDYWFYSC